MTALETPVPAKDLTHLDPEARLLRNLPRSWTMLVGLLGLLFGAFQLYTAYFGTYAPLIQRPVHLGFGLAIGLLLYAPFRSMVRNSYVLWIDAVLAAIGAYACLHLVASFEDLMIRFGAATPTDLVLGSILLLLVFELGRRTIGFTIPLLALIATLYVLFGPHLPASISHRGFSWNEFIEFNYLATDGLFGLPLGVSAEFIYVYLLLGALLTRTGAGEFFIELALRIAGRSTGGSAKVAVVASALFGSISGSVVANVLATGSVTIPLMKRAGYSKTFAAAVESTASTGGQMMPPVMGAAAFIMAEFIQQSYFDVVVYATVPAILYFVSVYVAVHLRSARLGLGAVDDIPRTPLLAFFAQGWPFFFSISVLLISLMGMRLSAERSAFFAILALLVADVTRSGPRVAGLRFVEATVGAARLSPPVIAAVALSGVIVGGLIASGISAKISTVILGLSDGHLVTTLLLVAAVSIILGTGMTTAADYIVTSLLGVPALIALGVPLEAAHLFVLYFACMSAVTPPVALGAYVAAGVAGSPPFRTGLASSRLAIAGLIIPFMFVYRPELLLMGAPLDILIAIFASLLGILSIAIAVEGWWRRALAIWERFGFFVAAITLCAPGWMTDATGLVLFSVLTIFHWLWRPAGSGSDSAGLRSSQP